LVCHSALVEALWRFLKNIKQIMPEGPSIVILKDAVKHFKKKKLLDASGSTTKIELERLNGKTVTDFKSWGKHFLICFQGFFVRVHFLLFGSYLINETKATKPRLSLRFDNGELNLYAGSVILVEGSPDDVYDWSADVMNKKWDEKKAAAKLKKMPGTLVCDALLDQNVFAGVGNIIKNEVLFRIKLHPKTTVGNIPPGVMKQLLKEAVNYSFDFLEWKKAYVLRKHWLAHTKKICPRCEIPLHKEYLGKTNRRTFFCDNCQIIYRET
jgi:endonuclease VIII